MVPPIKNAFIFLDRDGTIIVDKHYLADYREVELLPGVVKGLTRLKELGFKFIVVTNQSGLARGYLTEEDLGKIHERMRELLQDNGIRLEDILYCPHHADDNCMCRKPDTKLLDDVTEKYQFDYQKCFVIGDKECDILLGKKLGIKTFLIKKDERRAAEATKRIKPDFVVEDIMGAALIIQDLPGMK